MASRRKNPLRAKRPEAFGEERMIEDDQEMQVPSSFHTGSGRRSRLRWLAGVDLETCGIWEGADEWPWYVVLPFTFQAVDHIFA